jgi:proton-translocating NADH-quinone oxidoreductase chain N
MDLIILKAFIPEIFLSVCILLQLVFNATLVNNVKYNFPILDKEVLSQTFFILICVLFLLTNLKIEGFFSNFLFFTDISSRYIKIIFVLSCLFSLSPILRSFNVQKLNFFEYFTIFLLSIFSLLLLISSADMISAYLVIEMQALCFYILACFKRDSAFSTEAGLKYFVLGSFISGIFLFGCSIIYGVLGTLNFNSLNLLLIFSLKESFNELYMFLFIGILLITISLLFKLAVVPFHFWAPDVYEGAPLASTIIFSVLPKFALFSFFIRWFSIISDNFSLLNELLFCLGILSVTIGAFFALRQKRLKRLFIYSSIAQGGFLICALSLNTLNSIASIYFFLTIYILTSILLWSHVSLFHSFQTKINAFNNSFNKSLFLVNLSNLFKINSVWAFSFVLIFFSIAGVPPLSGFLSKIFILFGILETENIAGGLLLILISAFSVFYYLRIIKVFFFESKDLISKKNLSFQIIFNDYYFNVDVLIIAFLLFLLLFLFFYPAYLLLISHYIVLGSMSF